MNIVQMKREQDEIKRNNKITKALIGRRCPSKEEYVIGYIKERK